VKAATTATSCSSGRVHPRGAWDPANQAVRALVVTFLVPGSPNVVHEPGGEQMVRRLCSGLGRGNSKAAEPVE